MSYGIICRIGDCRDYAQFLIAAPNGKPSYACALHSLTFRRLRDLGQNDHNGADGMRSIEDQKANPIATPPPIQAEAAPAGASRAERRRLER